MKSEERKEGDKREEKGCFGTIFLSILFFFFFVSVCSIKKKLIDL